jgi:hypothetical protein
LDHMNTTIFQLIIPRMNSMSGMTRMGGVVAGDIAVVVASAGQIRCTALRV